MDAEARLYSAEVELLVCSRKDCCDVYVEEKWRYDSSLGESVEEVKWFREGSVVESQLDLGPVIEVLDECQEFRW